MIGPMRGFPTHRPRVSGCCILEERIETAPRLTRMVRDRIYRSLIVVKLC
ncbi:MAG: hypothetical protein V7642_693, partial [Burkholderiales bacterium]